VAEGRAGSPLGQTYLDREPLVIELALNLGEFIDLDLSRRILTHRGQPQPHR